jgi:hypothetical protein
MVIERSSSWMRTAASKRTSTERAAMGGLPGIVVLASLMSLSKYSG